MELAPGLPGELVPVAWLLGTWQGVGVAGYPTREEVRFGQEVVFGHAFGAGADGAAGPATTPATSPI